MYICMYVRSDHVMYDTIWGDVLSNEIIKWSTPKKLKSLW